MSSNEEKIKKNKPNLLSNAKTISDSFKQLQNRPLPAVNNPPISNKNNYSNLETIGSNSSTNMPTRSSSNASSLSSSTSNYTSNNSTSSNFMLNNSASNNYSAIANSTATLPFSSKILMIDSNKNETILEEREEDYDIKTGELKQPANAPPTTSSLLSSSTSKTPTSNIPSSNTSSSNTPTSSNTT